MKRNKTPDWEAYACLQKLYSERLNAFSLEASDFAMSKCLEGPSRKAKGNQLGKDLFRDGKKKALKLRNNLPLEEGFHYGSFVQCEQATFQQDISKESVLNTIIIFLRSLTKQHRDALSMALCGIKSTDPKVQTQLGIKARQFRSILTRVRAAIDNCESRQFAFYMALHVFGFTSQDFIDLIQAL